VSTVRGVSARAAGRAASVGLLAVFILLATVFLTGSAVAEHSAMLASSSVALISVGAGLRLHRVADLQPWLLVVLGLVLLNVVNTLSWIGDLFHGDASRWPVAPFQITGYLALLAASMLILWRRVPHDRGGIIDAAVVGIAAAAPVWEFVLRPALVATGTALAGQVVVLTQILVLLGTSGALLRITRASARRHVSVWLLFGSLSCAVLGDIVFTTSGREAGSAAALAGLLYLGGYLLIGAAALHPTIGTLTQPVPVRDAEVPQLRLGLFGAALVVVPLVGGIPQLFGEPADGLLLTLGPLAMVPLVLIRAGQLINQRAQDQRDLAFHAYHDALTGLVNRRRFFDLMTQAMADAPDSSHAPSAVLYCDLDDFKPINDHYGHEAGDEVLRCAGRRLTEVLREHDVVARIGGDEFLIHCPDTDAAAAAGLQQRVETALREPMTWNGNVLRIGATVGTAVTGGDQFSSPDELIAAADSAMYERKRIRKSARPAQPGMVSAADRTAPARPATHP
jgi:diguanylate cyclase (GGDEF)-like protein